jgi:hypothetical protein
MITTSSSLGTVRPQHNSDAFTHIAYQNPFCLTILKIVELVQKCGHEM